MKFIHTIHKLFHTIIIKTTIPAIIGNGTLLLLGSQKLLPRCFETEELLYPLFYNLFTLFYLMFYTIPCRRHGRRFSKKGSLKRPDYDPLVWPIRELTCNYPQECSLLPKAWLLFLSFALLRGLSNSQN